MARDYTPLPFEFLEEMDGLSDEEYGRLIRGMQRYSMTGEEPELEGTERLFWKRCRNTIDRYAASYDSLCSARAESGKKGGRPKKQTVFPEKQKKQMVSDEKQNNLMVFGESKEKQNNLSETKSETKTNTETNTPPKPPKGRTDAEFAEFWNAYPTKVGKQPARKAFDKVKVPVKTLVDAIERQKCSSQWSKDGGQYIPNPATWLNQQRWEDVLPEAEKPAWNGGRRELDADEAEAIRRMFGGG